MERMSGTQGPLFAKLTSGAPQSSTALNQTQKPALTKSGTANLGGMLANLQKNMAATRGSNASPDLQRKNSDEDDVTPKHGSTPDQKGNDFSEYASPDVRGRRFSMLRDMSPTLSRKEKLEYYEVKFNEFDEIIPQLGDTVEALTTELAETKATMQE